MAASGRGARKGDGIARARFADTLVDLTASSAERHHGLRNMTNRDRMLDGHLDIASAPGRGTTITLVVPLSG